MQELPYEILLHIFSFVEPDQKERTRISILSTNSTIRNLCLKILWKPWDRKCKGLRFAVQNGYIGYFRRWRKEAPEKSLIYLSGSCSIFEIAARQGYLDFIKMFSKDPLSKPGGVLDLNLHRWLAFKVACREQKVKIIRYFLKTNEFDGDMVLSNDALIQACRRGYHKTVKVLLEDGRFCPEVLDNYCIRKACKYGHTKVLELLLDDGRADPNVGEGEAILNAYEKGHKDIVEALLADWRIRVPKSLSHRLDVAGNLYSDEEESSSY